MAKQVPKGDAVLWVAVVRPGRRWVIGGSDLGDGESFGYDGSGGWVAPEENEGKH